MEKRIIYILIVGLFFNQLSLGQDHKEFKREQIKAQKVAFITERLQLSVEQAQSFWPVYNEFEAQKDKIQDRRIEMYKTYKNSKNLTDKELEKIADEYVTLSLQESKLLEQYHSRFKKLLSAEQLIKLYESEIRFKGFLLKQIRKHGRDEKGGIDSHED